MNRHKLEPKIGIVGRGRVGLSLHKALIRNGHEHAFLISHTEPLKQIASCHAVILAIPDHSIRVMAKKILSVTFDNPDIVLVHTSGILTSEELRPAKANTSARIHLASMHPLQTFSSHQRTVIQSIFFAIEGDPEAIPYLKRLLKIVQAKHFIILKEHKPIYHASAVIASNFSVALMHMAARLFSNLGKTESEALKILSPIVQNTFHNIFSDGISKSLTGPAARRDFKTIRLHKKALRNVEPFFVSAYNELTKLCLSIPLETLKKGHR